MIYPTEIGIIVKLIRKPNAIIVLPFIQSISKILTTLPSSRISSENFACLRHIYRICTVIFLQILFKRPDDFNRAMFLFCACFCICPVYFKSVIGLFPLRITVDYFEINLSSLMLKQKLVSPSRFLQTTSLSIAYCLHLPHEDSVSWI